MLDLLQDLVYKLLKCYIHPFFSVDGVLPPPPSISSRPLSKALSLVLPLVLRCN